MYWIKTKKKIFSKEGMISTFCLYSSKSQKELLLLQAQLLPEFPWWHFASCIDSDTWYSL